MISIVIPVWNNASSLRQALVSLDAQIFREFDVTVIDDGSTNDDARTVSNQTWSFPIAYHKLAKNAGAPTARNEGAMRSKGEMLLFLDSDITLQSNALQRMHDELTRHVEADFVYSGFRFGWKTFHGRAFDEGALRETNYIHTSALMRRSAFPGFDPALKKFQDWDLWLRMTAQGSKGVWIPEVLMHVKTGGTMSAWLPRVTYQLPWPLFGWMPRPMKKFLDAEKIIQEKHGLIARRHEEQDAVTRFGIHVFVGIVALEWLSFFIYPNPRLMTAVALGIGAIFVWISWRFPVYAFLFWMTELFVGSFGGLFRAFGDAELHGGFSIRELLFAGFILGSGIDIVQRFIVSQTRAQEPVLRRWVSGMRALHTQKNQEREKDHSIPLMLAVLISALMLGWVQNPRMFVLADANGWMVFALAPLLAIRVNVSTRRPWNLLRATTVASLTFLGLLTLKMWFLYAHPLGDALHAYTYFWVRRTGLGELTQVVADRQLYRVFFQSHVYMALALPFVWWWKRERTASVIASAFTILCYATLIISLSRSFWIGAMVMGAFFLVIGYERHDWRGRGTFVAQEGFHALVALLCVWGLALAPFPPTSASFLAVFGSRVAGEEGSVSSRRAQLAPLIQKIREAPLFGSGFGATVTYKSSDPRVIATGNEMRTTFAFEWGWLDLLVKFGFVGVIVYLLCLAQLWKRLRAVAERGEALAWTTALVGLMTIHVFTPYLNHPLGFGFLTLLWMRTQAKSPTSIGE